MNSVGPNLKKVKKELPGNLKHNPIELGHITFQWALRESVGMKHRGSVMRTLIRRQCSMIYVKKVALALVDDMEELSLIINKVTEGGVSVKSRSLDKTR